MTDDELSAAVAEALGLPAGDPEAPKGGFAIDLRAGTCRDIPATVPYATDWSAAAQVIEAMREQRWTCAHLYLVLGRWTVSFDGHHSGDSGEAGDDSLPRAVCLAALAALEASHD